MQAAARTLDPVPGIDLEAYQEQLIRRFANPTIAHRTRQIAMDGSQKLPQRIFAAAVDDLGAGHDGAEFAYATALWIAYVLQTPDVDDPRRDELAAAATEAIAKSEPSAFFNVSGLAWLVACSANEQGADQPQHNDALQDEHWPLVRHGTRPWEPSIRPASSLAVDAQRIRYEQYHLSHRTGCCRYRRSVVFRAAMIENGKLLPHMLAGICTLL